MISENARDSGGRESAEQIRTIVDRLLFLLQDGISPFVEQQMQTRYKMAWIERANRHLARPVDPAYLHFDVHALLKIMVGEWDGLFKEKLAPVQKTHVQGLIVLRNRWAHQRPVSPQMLLGGLASTRRLLEAAGSEHQARQVAILQDRLTDLLKAEAGPAPEVSPPLAPPWPAIALTLILLAVLAVLRYLNPDLAPPASAPVTVASMAGMAASPLETATTWTTALATVPATAGLPAALPAAAPLPSPTPSEPAKAPAPAPSPALSPTPFVFEAVSVAPSNLRAGPGTVYPIVGTVWANVPLRIVGRDRTGQWYKLEGGEWIAAFLAVIDPPLPVVGIDPTTTPALTPCSTCPPAIPTY